MRYAHVNDNVIALGWTNIVVLADWLVERLIGRSIDLFSYLPLF